MFHSHHAVVSDTMKARARRAVEKIAVRLRRAVDAVVRFEADGPDRRVEILLHAPRRRNMVAEGRGKFFGSALAEAIERLEEQARRRRSVGRSQSRKPVRV